MTLALKNDTGGVNDGRRTVDTLYAAFDALCDDGWRREEVVQSRRGADVLPILSYRSPQKGPAIWIISGIHGEEPAGPNAIAVAIDVIRELGRRHAVVLLPLCNPLGYKDNWRYVNMPTWQPAGGEHSPGDSDHILLNDKGAARIASPVCPESGALIDHVLRLVADYPPRLTLDLHEDDMLDEGYVYSQGRCDVAAEKVVDLLSRAGICVRQDGATRFGEKITGGIVRATGDGSIDELLAAEKIIVSGKIVPGPAAPSVLVVETPAGALPLSARQKAHEEILRHLEGLLP